MCTAVYCFSSTHFFFHVSSCITFACVVNEIKIDGQLLSSSSCVCPLLLKMINVAIYISAPFMERVVSA